MGNSQFPIQTDLAVKEIGMLVYETYAEKHPHMLVMRDVFQAMINTTQIPIAEKVLVVLEMLKSASLDKKEDSDAIVGLCMMWLAESPLQHKTLDQLMTLLEEEYDATGSTAETR